jgi:hypothetical protein
LHLHHTCNSQLTVLRLLLLPTSVTYHNSVSYEPNKLIPDAIEFLGTYLLVSKLTIRQTNFPWVLGGFKVRYSGLNGLIAELSVCRSRLACAHSHVAKGICIECSYTPCIGIHRCAALLRPTFSPGRLQSPLLGLKM